jgi:hypothetical protein
VVLFPDHPTVKKQIVHCNKEHFDLFIGRPSKWSNKFIIGVDGTRAQVIAKYRKWIRTQPKLLDSIHELDGKVLGCWCDPKPCHGQVLLELLAEWKRRNAKRRIDK